MDPLSTMSLRGSTAATLNASGRFPGTVCVMTILFGGFDKLLAPPQHLISPNVDFYVVTDQAGAGHPPPWKEFVVSPLPYNNSRQNARSSKILPPDELWNRCDIAIQVDANIDFIRSPLELASELQPNADLGLVRHPFLSNYQAEIDHLCQIYPHDCALYQSHSRRHGHFNGNKAHQYETSFLIRRHNDRTRTLMQTWRDDLFASGHLRDQVALVPMLHAHNADIEVYGPGGKLLQNDLKASNSNADSPVFIQIYKGHNHDFAKWRCHGKVMGQKRSALAHTAYCGVYYVTKRYVPWVESLAPISYNSIKAMDLKNPVKAVLVSILFLLFALAVFFPRSSIMLRLRSVWVTYCSPMKQSTWVHYRNEVVSKMIVLSVRLSILIGTGIWMTCSYFYTFTIGVACLWPSIVIFAPPIFLALMARHLYLEILRKKTSRGNIR